MKMKTLTNMILFALIGTAIGWSLACGSYDPAAPDAAVDYIIGDNSAHSCEQWEMEQTVACGEIQGGWSLQCRGDRVYVDNLSSQRRCAADGARPQVCIAGGVGDEVVVARCPRGCGDLERYYFEGFDDYLAQWPPSVCE
jgi:hypothetical protein